MRKGNQLAMMLVFFAVVLAVFAAVTQLTTGEAVDVDDTARLSDVDFSRQVARLSIGCYERYPSALYTPEDFAQGRVTQAPSDEHPAMEHGYGTYRMVLRLEAGKVYGISAYTATYAQKLWIDGVLVSQMGTPGDSLETTVPKTGYFTVYFTAGDETEIVLQRSDFVHANGGQVYPLNLGEQPRVTALANGILLQGLLVVGCALMAALFFFGIYLFFKKLPYLLWFSLACLMITVYTLTVDHKMIMLLFPGMPWWLSHRLEYVAAVGMVFFFFLYVMRMFRQSARRPVNVCGIVVLCVYLAFVLFTPSLVYTTAMPYLRACGVLYCCGALALLVRAMVKDAARRRPEHYLMLCGTFVYIALTVAGIPLHYNGFLGEDDFFRLGLMILIFANTLALALNFTHTETALEDAQRKQRELDESNRMLDSMNAMKTQLMANIGHELKTPLTVMSVNAQVSKALVNMEGDKAEIGRNLDVITGEAQRMARMVGEVLALGSLQENQTGMAALDLSALLENTAAVCRHFVEKRQNRFAVAVAPGLRARGDADMLVQVVVNLLTNAGAHTQGGEISLKAVAQGGGALVTVGDTGEGIPAALLPHVFERHVKGTDGGAGLGLPICKAIIERHGGRIEIESTEGKGAAVWFTLPLDGEEDAGNGR